MATPMPREDPVTRASGGFTVWSGKSDGIDPQTEGNGTRNLTIRIASYTNGHAPSRHGSLGAFVWRRGWRGKLRGQELVPWLVHGGASQQERKQATVLPWNDLAPLLDRVGAGA